MRQFDNCPTCNTFFSIIEIKSEDPSAPEQLEAVCCPNNFCQFSRDKMTNGFFKTCELNENELANITLHALVNSLKSLSHTNFNSIYRI